MLAVYGDFVASCVIKDPQLVLSYSSYAWHEPATMILKKFYESADITPPSWLDLLAEQTIVQEAEEERQFELRGFLRQCIMKSYKDNLYAIQDTNFAKWDPVTDTYKRIDKQPTFKDILDYCLRNKTIQFLHRIKQNLGRGSGIAITSNIRAEMKKQDKNTSSATMETIAAKIPGFEYIQKRIGDDNDRIWTVCGSLSDFEKYLDYEINENLDWEKNR